MQSALHLPTRNTCPGTSWRTGKREGMGGMGEGNSQTHRHTHLHNNRKVKPGNTPPCSGAPAHATLQNPVLMGKVRGRGEATVNSPSPWSGGTRAPAHWQPNAKSRAIWGGSRPPSNINCYRPGSVGGPRGSRARGAGWARGLPLSSPARWGCH